MKERQRPRPVEEEVQEPHPLLASRRCPTCGGLTTQATGPCAQCLARPDNRKAGALWLVLGLAVLVLGGALLSTGRPELTRAARWFWLGCLVTGWGVWVVGRGLRAILTGRSPERGPM